MNGMQECYESNRGYLWECYQLLMALNTGDYLMAHIPSYFRPLPEISEVWERVKQADRANDQGMIEGALLEELERVTLETVAKIEAEQAEYRKAMGTEESKTA